MSCSGIPGLPTFVKIAVACVTVSFGTAVFSVWQSRRGAVPVFDVAAVTSTEVFARYPCRTLRGMDLVVRNYFVRRSQEGGEARAARPDWRSVFSNESFRRTGGHSEEDRQSMRVVVGTADPTEGRKAIAFTSATWPPGTDKYTALVLEPSAKPPSEDDSFLPPAPVERLRNPLRWLADSATHQSLLRCNPRSTMLDMNCDADPSYLGATYLRVMLSAFLLLPTTLMSTHRVAVLGVGGGSLSNFLQQYFSGIIQQMDLVDVEPTCFTAAVKDCGMRENLSAQQAVSVRLFTEDGAAYLRRYAQTLGSTSTTSCTVPSSLEEAPLPPTGRPLDVLFVDMFAGSELHPAVATTDFVQLCWRALSTYGVVAFNLPTADPLFTKICAEVFGPLNVYTIQAPQCSNMVVLARGGWGGGGLTTELPHLSHRLLYQRARELTKRYKLPYRLADHYPSWWRFW